MVGERGHFYGVYLLLCRNPKFQGRVYIGFTVNPQRRVRQHNAGKRHGGAWRTSGRGPWDMVLIVHGFPSAVAALKFEWSWQHPSRCRQLAGVRGRSRAEGSYPFHLRLLWELLRCPRWGRFPLTLRWIHQQHRQEWPPGSAPPPHVALAFGEVGGGPAEEGSETETGMEMWTGTGGECSVCGKPLTEDGVLVSCVHPWCTARSHIICLAQRFLQGDPEQLLPLEGVCPGCGRSFLWGNLMRHMSESRKDRGTVCLSEPPQQGHWADLLSI
ncbi:structure-specific endonuclease subunit SLX1 [Mobula hypostoma]|uniref:structure-specific endonuclease subunit SLX1 n=1 Tax=Mobula hypostoma TaxID=723540 RepID=UPI002FC2E41E